MIEQKDFLDEAMDAAKEAHQKRMTEGYAWHAQVLAMEILVLRDQLAASRNNQDWIITAQRLPTSADARNGLVLVFYPERTWDVDMEQTHWSDVAEHPKEYPLWRPMPTPPVRRDERTT